MRGVQTFSSFDVVPVGCCERRENAIMRSGEERQSLTWGHSSVVDILSFLLAGERPRCACVSVQMNDDCNRIHHIENVCKMVYCYAWGRPEDFKGAWDEKGEHTGGLGSFWQLVKLLLAMMIKSLCERSFRRAGVLCGDCQARPLRSIQFAERAITFLLIPAREWWEKEDLRGWDQWRCKPAVISATIQVAVFVLPGLLRDTQGQGSIVSNLFLFSQHQTHTPAQEHSQTRTAKHW